MKVIYIVGLLVLCLSVRAQTPSWQWAKSAGSVQFDGAFEISTDVAGKGLVTGHFTDSITFGTTTLISAGDYDIFVAKYDASGNVLWAKSAGGTSADFSRGISTDAVGNVLVTGSYQSSFITFGTTTLSGGGRMFVVKYDPSGNVLWAKSSGAAGLDDEGIAVSTDVNSNVYVTGHFYPPFISFGTTTLAGAGIFVVKYDSSGAFLWAKVGGGTGFDYLSGISIDPSGNILITGDFDGPSVTFGSITLTNTSPLSSRDIFIVKYDASGNVLWGRSAGGRFIDYALAISNDATGNVLLTGFFNDTIVFGSSTLIGHGIKDVFVAKYDSSGNALWAHSLWTHMGGPHFVGTHGISVDASGNILVTGYFTDTLVFGATSLISQGGKDIFVVKYDTSGNALWAKSAGGSSDEDATGIATYAGDILVSGYFCSQVCTFGTSSLTNVGLCDFFIAKLDTTVVGITEINNALNTITAFPNPGNGLFSVESADMIDEIKICNLFGQIVFEAKPKANKFALQLDNEGMYLLQLTLNKQTVIKKLIVKK